MSNLQAMLLAGVGVAVISSWAVWMGSEGGEWKITIWVRCKCRLLGAWLMSKYSGGSGSKPPERKK